MTDALALEEPLSLLRATVRGKIIRCAGYVVTALHYPVLVMCQRLALTDLPDAALSVSFDGEPPSLLVGSFRDTARWTIGSWGREPPADTPPAGSHRNDPPQPRRKSSHERT